MSQSAARLGSALVTLGATGSVAYWIYGLQASPAESFWQLPGYLSLVVLVVGFALLIFASVRNARNGQGHQVQQAGDASTNLQAGRDIRIGEQDED